MRSKSHATGDNGATPPPRSQQPTHSQPSNREGGMLSPPLRVPPTTALSTREVTTLKHELLAVERQRDKAQREAEELRQKVIEMTEHNQALQTDKAAALRAQKEGQQQGMRQKNFEVRFREAQQKFQDKERQYNELVKRSQEQDQEANRVVNQWQEHSNTLQRTLDDVNETLAHEKEHRLKLVEERAQLNARLDELRVALEDADRREDRRTQELNRLREEKNRLEAAVDSASVAGQRAGDEVSTLRDHVSSLQKEVAQLMTQLNESQAATKRASERAANLSAELQEEHDRRAALEKTEVRLREQLRDAAEQRDELQVNLDEARRRATSLETRCRALEQDVSQERSAATTAGGREAELRARIDELADKAAEQDVELARVRRDLMKATGETQDKQRRVQLLEAEALDAENRVHKAEAVAAEAKAAASDAHKALDDAQLAAAKELQNAQEAHEATRRAKAGIEGELERCKSKVEQLQQVLNDMQDQAANMSKNESEAVATASTHVAARLEAERVAAAMRAEKEELEDRLAKLQADHATTSDALNTAGRELAEAREAHHQAVARCNELENAVQAHEAHGRTLAQAAATASSERDAAKTQESATAAKLSALESYTREFASTLCQCFPASNDVVQPTAGLSPEAALQVSKTAVLTFTKSRSEATEKVLKFNDELQANIAAAVDKLRVEAEGAARLREELAAVRSENAELRSKSETARSQSRHAVDNQRREVDRIRRELADAQTEASRAEGRVKMLEEEMKSKQDEVAKAAKDARNQLQRAEEYKGAFLKLKEKFDRSENARRNEHKKLDHMKSQLDHVRVEWSDFCDQYRRLKADYLRICTAARVEEAPISSIFGAEANEPRRQALPQEQADPRSVGQKQPEPRAASRALAMAADAVDKGRESNVLGIVAGNVGRRSEGRKSVSFAPEVLQPEKSTKRNRTEDAA